MQYVTRNHKKHRFDVALNDIYLQTQSKNSFHLFLVFKFILIGFTGLTACNTVLPDHLDIPSLTVLNINKQKNQQTITIQIYFLSRKNQESRQSDCVAKQPVNKPDAEAEDRCRNVVQLLSKPGNLNMINMRHVAVSCHSFTL